jgi:hypothetical protein
MARGDAPAHDSVISEFHSDQTEDDMTLGSHLLIVLATMGRI